MSPSHAFKSQNELRKHVKEEIAELQETLGYIEPCHGSKGKIRELHDDEDVTEKFMLHKRKSDVLLWLYGKAVSEVGDTAQLRKQLRVDNPAPSSKHEAIAKTMHFEKLSERHLCVVKAWVTSPRALYYNYIHRMVTMVMHPVM